MKKIILFGLIFFTFSCSFFKFSYDKAYSFRSYNFPDMYMRHSYYNGILTVLNTEIDVNDGSFKIVKGLSDPKGVSFESINFPGYFLKHFSYKIILGQYEENDTYKKDATFYIRDGLIDKKAVSIESYNFPGYFIRHSNFEMIISENDNSEVFYKDASFFLVKR